VAGRGGGSGIGPARGDFARRLEKSRRGILRFRRIPAFGGHADGRRGSRGREWWRAAVLGLRPGVGCPRGSSRDGSAICRLSPRGSGGPHLAVAGDRVGFPGRRRCSGVLGEAAAYGRLRAAVLLLRATWPQACGAGSMDSGTRPVRSRSGTPRAVQGKCSALHTSRLYPKRRSCPTGRTAANAFRK
jgi:hypothetical protein